MGPLQALNPGYPMGTHYDEAEWWPVQLSRQQVSANSVELPAPGRQMRGVVTYSSAINVDDDEDPEIFQCGWRPQSPADGYLVVVDFAGGVPVSAKKFDIDGCSNVWRLRGQAGQADLVAVVGLDEGKLGTTPANVAIAKTYLYDPQTGSLVDTGIVNDSHESVVVDIDGDGDEDVIACNWNGTENGRLTWLENAGGSLSMRPIGPSHLACMAVEVLDVDSDGQWELVVTDANTFVDGVEPERNQLFRLNPDLSFAAVAELPLPYFERAAFDGLPTLQGWEGGVGRSHDVQVARGDIDADGDDDLVMSSMIWAADNQTAFAAFQILVNHNGTFQDESDARMINQLFHRHATHNFELRDVNGDGFVDILSQGSDFCCFPDDVDTSLTHAQQVYVNDGTGHFVNAVGYQFGTFQRDPLTYAPYQGKPRWIRIADPELDRFDAVTVTTLSLPFEWSSGPAGSDPAGYGAPGFNEAYYLRTQASAALSVRDGTDESGLAHYLRLGRNLGYPSFASGAVVQGSGNNDRIVLREGDETAFGNAGDDVFLPGPGNDTLSGGPGVDRFVFVPGDGINRITDFLPGTDIIDVSGAPGARVSVVQKQEYLEIRIGPDVRVLLSDLELAEFDGLRDMQPPQDVANSEFMTPLMQLLLE